jgi:hypothetical protein
MEDWEEESWENVVIPDLLVSIENKEREKRLLDERKLVEDADAELTEDLFANGPKEIKVQKPHNILKPIAKKEKPVELIEKRQKELREKQIEEAKKKKEQKARKMRLKETYGEAEDDVYDDMYGDIEDKY